MAQTCRVCKQIKNIGEYGFHIRNKKHKSECKECARLESVQYRIKNREKYLRTASNSQLKKNYGFSLEKYEELLEKQNGKCAICGDASPKQKNIKRFAVDHCHTSKKIRGLLCANCNKGIGLLGDNIEILEKAIKYLEENS